MKSLRIHYFQHVPFEGLGYIETWASENKHQLSSTQFYKGELPPNVEEIDWLIVMGGPMNIYEETTYPWLITEKSFIKQAIEQNKPVLGICLGSQLIASVLGARIKANQMKEIGWFPVEFTPDKVFYTAFKGIPKQRTVVFHWHGDTFDLPEGAVLISSSEVCRNQAFIFKDNVIGFQFHLETTIESLKNMLYHGKEELKENGAYIQNPDTILLGANHIRDNNKLMAHVLNGMYLTMNDEH